jgi:hypothetical protein
MWFIGGQRDWYPDFAGDAEENLLLEIARIAKEHDIIRIPEASA